MYVRCSCVRYKCVLVFAYTVLADVSMACFCYNNFRSNIYMYNDKKYLYAFHMDTK